MTTTRDLDAVDRALEPDQRCASCGRYSTRLVNHICPNCRWEIRQAQMDFDRDQHTRGGERL